MKYSSCQKRQHREVDPATGYAGWKGMHQRPLALACLRKNFEISNGLACWAWPASGSLKRSPIMDPLWTEPHEVQLCPRRHQRTPGRSNRTEPHVRHSVLRGSLQGLFDCSVKDRLDLVWTKYFRPRDPLRTESRTCSSVLRGSLLGRDLGNPKQAKPRPSDQPI